MDKIKKTQLLKLFLMAIILSVTPLLSTSLRPPYLYFVFNLFIIALGAEAGLLSFIFKPSEDKRSSTPSSPSSTVTQKPIILLPPEDCPNREKSANTNATVESESTAKKKPKAPVVEKSTSEKIVSVAKVHKALKKCPSTSSLFFIGGGESEAEDFSSEEDCDQQEAVGDELSGQELFHKAETFIGNFYKQLKMQRENSWKKIHGLYQKAF